MTSGYMIRQEQRLQAAGEKPCPGCGHPNYRHHELQRATFSLSEDQTEIVETLNPDYQPLHFHCDVEDCPCVIVCTGKVRQFTTTTTDPESSRIANRYPGKCITCEGWVAELTGTWDRSDGVRHATGKCKRRSK